MVHIVVGQHIGIGGAPCKTRVRGRTAGPAAPAPEALGARVLAAHATTDVPVASALEALLQRAARGKRQLRWVNCRRGVGHCGAATEWAASAKPVGELGERVRERCCSGARPVMWPRRRFRRVARRARCNALLNVLGHVARIASSRGGRAGCGAAGRPGEVHIADQFRRATGTSSARAALRAGKACGTKDAFGSGNRAGLGSSRSASEAVTVPVLLTSHVAAGVLLTTPAPARGALARPPIRLTSASRLKVFSIRVGAPVVSRPPLPSMTGGASAGGAPTCERERHARSSGAACEPSSASGWVPPCE
eukprot:scaffold265645_cov23-Tisochrysis_lutea.AAC.3